MNHYADNNFTLAPAPNSRVGTLRGLSSMTFENGTLRGFSSLPQEILDIPPPHVEMAITPSSKARPEVAISNFKIVFDNGEKYHPGMDITGKVVMDVWSPVTIRYVEFVLEGRATARIFKTGRKFAQRTKTEAYLYKKILLLRPANGQPSMTLSPGKYVSTFMYKLPTSIPTTVQQADLGGGHVFSIAYSAQANVCDFIPNSKYGKKNDKYARVVKSIKDYFTVVPDTNYQSIPGALDPITHAEQVNLCCGCIGGESTSVLVKLNHQVYTVGDVMRLHLEIYTPSPSRIGNIEAQFEQKIVVRCGNDNQQVRNKRTLIRAVDDTRERKYKTETKMSESIRTRTNDNVYKTGFRIPIPGNLIPSLLPYSRIVDIYYFMNINVSFRKLGGTLNLRIPLTITPAMDPDIVQQKEQQHIPLFNRPIIQFPHFAHKNPLRESRVSISSTTTMASQESATLRKFKDTKHRKKHEKVKVTHKNVLGF